MCLDPGTRQSDHLAVPVHFFAVFQSGKQQSNLNFSVCLGSGHMAKFESLPCALDPSTQRSSNLCRVPRILAHGEVGSRRRHRPCPDPPSYSLICRVPALAHGEAGFAVAAGRHGSFAVSRARQIYLPCVFWPSLCAWGTRQMRGIR